MIRRRILITGGAGFIGFHLATRLAADPANEITLVDNFSRARTDDDFSTLCRHPQITLVSGDLLDEATYLTIGAGYDEVYHLAALLGVENVLRRPVDVLRINAVMTARFLEWFTSGGGARLLFSSTSEVYAWTSHFHQIPVPTPEDVPLALTDLRNPRSTYAGGKIFGELAVTHYCLASSQPFVIVRYHNVYGPRMGYDHVIPQLHQRAAGGQHPLVVYGADHIRAFCYVDDAVSATIAAMRSPRAANETLNIGNDTEETTIESLARRILAASELPPNIAPAPAPNDPIQRRCPDISKARRILNYHPAVSLDQGLRATLAWYSKVTYAAAR